MNWLFFAISSPIAYTINNFIDKYLVSKVAKDYKIMPVYSAIVALIFGSFIWFIVGMPILSLHSTLIILLIGILINWSLLVYFKALQFEETSKIILLFQFIPIFILILSTLFLREDIQAKQYFGFFLIFIGSILILFKKEKNQFKFSKKSLLYMLIYDLIFAVTAILIKFISTSNSFWSMLPYESWGIAIGGIFLYLLNKQIRKAFNKNIRKINIKTAAIFSFNETVFILAKSLGYYAFFIGPVVLVSVLGNTQVFFGILFGVLLTLFLPKIFQENISRKGLLLKIISAIILFVGISLF